MNKQKVHIKGMHCRSCEIMIEDELKKINGVEKVSVSHQTGIAEVDCACTLDQNAVQAAIERAGYTLGSDGKLSLISKNFYDYTDVGIAFFIVFSLYILARAFGIFNLGNSLSGNYANLSVVFLVGLTAGISTCMALVGGLVLGASSRFAAQHPTATSLQKFTPHIYFNLGRIASYFVLGGILGYAGSLFQLSTSVLGLLTITVGLIMLLLGSQLTELFPILKKISFTLPTGVSKVLGIKEQNAAVMGAFTFFLPCGFTQAMQLFAISTGNPLQGALTMGVFALGTAPGLLGIGGLASAVKGSAGRIFFKMAGVVVIALSIFNISNGLNLLGIPAVLATFTGQAQAIANDRNVRLVNGVQEVRMIQNAGGYSPNTFTIQKGIPVRWIITSTDNFSCAASIVSQQLGIRKALDKGENIIEFTPDTEGTIRFSCSMGMYTGSFNVGNATSEAQPESVNGVSCGSGGCGCGGGAKKAVTTTGETITAGQVQLLKASYTSLGDIQPSYFIVKANQPVRFEIDAKEDGQGCMGSVTVPTLTKKVKVFTKGEKTVFEFTPTSKGSFPITCAMGVPRGEINVL